MTDHLEFEAVIAPDEVDHVQGELRFQHLIIVIAADIPPENRFQGILPHKTIEGRIRNHAQLRIHREAFVREIIGGFQGDATAVSGEIADGEFTENIQMPGIPETLGQCDERWMNLVVFVLQQVRIDRNRQLVSKAHAGPQGDVQRGAEVPDGLVYLVDDQVLEGDLRVDHDIRLRKGVIELGLLADGIPGSIQTLGRAPHTIIICKGYFRHLEGGTDHLDRLGSIQTGRLDEPGGTGKALRRDFIPVVFDGEDREIRGLDRTYIGEALICQHPGRTVHTRGKRVLRECSPRYRQTEQVQEGFFHKLLFSNLQN